MIRIVIGVVLAAALGALGFAWGRRSWRESAKPKARRTTHPDTVECRAAVHEAGHALVAWACFIVDHITFVLLADGGNGQVRYRFWRPTYKDDSDWCDAVISLGGVAAEVVLYRQASTRGSEEDLCGARSAIARLIDRSVLSPPWEVASALPPVPFAHLFDPPLSDAERRGLEIVYGKACELLRDGAVQHGRLVGALLHQRRLSYAQVLGILGERHWMAAKVLNSALKRPGAMQAGFVKIATVS